MQITDPINNPRLLIEKIKADVMQQLRPGHSLQAQVVALNEKGMVQLRIGGSVINASTQLQLGIGEKLLLNVVKMGELPEFSVVRETSIKALQTQLLKTILPKQIPLQQLLDGLENIKQISSGGVVSPPPSTPTNRASLADLFRQIIQGINNNKGVLQTLPASPDTKPSPLQQLQTLHTALFNSTAQKANPSTPLNSTQALIQRIQEVLWLTPSQNSPITTERIRQAMELSGLFLEARLSSGKPPEPDLKAALLKLLFQLQSHPGTDLRQLTVAGVKGTTTPGEALTAMAARFFAELRTQTEGSLARIQLHQLATLPQEEGQKQVWQFELPIRHSDGTNSFLIRLEREQRPTQEGVDDCWSVTLDFDLEPAGAIRAKLTLNDEEISTAFLAERLESVALVEHHLPQLNTALIRAGLKVGTLSARQEPTPPHPEQQFALLPLLDEKA